MACYHPIDAWYSNSKATYAKSGKPLIVFKPEYGDPSTQFKVSCGQCIGCRLERSRQWAIRIQHEASLHDNNCFLTLTYAPEHEDKLRVIDEETGEVFSRLSLNKRDYVLFLKRLRKRFGEGIRFFQCGEYGDKLGRPHHHMILFGFDFPDKELFAKNNGFPLYTSEILRELWPYGYVSIAGVTFESAAYVARYVTKKVTGDQADNHYSGRLPEYVTMSRRPGIARQFAEEYLSSIYPKDSLTVRPGMRARPPKFYDKIYDSKFPEKFLQIKEKRKRFLEEHPEEQTMDRLAVKEKIQHLKAQKLIRPIENGELIL